MPLRFSEISAYKYLRVLAFLPLLVGVELAIQKSRIDVTDGYKERTVSPTPKVSTVESLQTPSLDEHDATSTIEDFLDAHGNPTGYARDKQSIYLYSYAETNVGEYVRIPDADLSTFEPVYGQFGPVSEPYDYEEALLMPVGKDRAHVFLGAAVVPGVDAATFSALSSPYFQDAEHVYFYFSSRDAGTYWELIQGADPAQFAILGAGYSKDGDHVFFFYTKIAADLASFSVLSNPRPCGVSCNYDVEDVDHKFYHGQVVQ